jgi:hypothetical protein
MMFRSLVASVCAVCCIASVLSPVEASARLGGSTIGRGLMFHEAVPRPGLRPSVRIGRGPALVARSAVTRNIHRAHVVPVRRFRRVFGPRLPLNGIGVNYGSNYDPGDYSGAAWQYPPVQTVADTPSLFEGDSGVIGRRCGSQTVVVPSEAGGERPITVTRCRSQ